MTANTNTETPQRLLHRLRRNFRRNENVTNFSARSPYDSTNAGAYADRANASTNAGAYT